MFEAPSRPGNSRSVFWLIALISMLQSVLATGQELDRIEAQEAQMQLLRQVPIASEVAGVLVLVEPTEEGVPVRGGDILMKLNDSVIRAEVDRARLQAGLMTEIEFAEVALETALENQKQKQTANEKRPGAFTPSEMRQVDLEVRKGEAQLRKSKEDKTLHELELKVKEAQLEQYTVTAPFDGFVTKVTRYPGQSVRPGDPVLTLTDMSELRASLKVHFRHRDRLFVGDEVEIRIDSGPGTPRSTPPVNDRPVAGDDSSDVGRLFGGGDPPPAVPARKPESRNERAESVRESAGGEVFIGRITLIDPKVEPDATQTLMIKLGVSVPNRKDRFGRYMLQEGMPVKAVVLAKKR